MFEAGRRAPALHRRPTSRSATTPTSPGFGDAGASGIPLPAVPEIATVFEAIGLAEANVLKGADPTTEFTERRQRRSGSGSAGSR